MVTVYLNIRVQYIGIARVNAGLDNIRVQWSARTPIRPCFARSGLLGHRLWPDVNSFYYEGNLIDCDGDDYTATESLKAASKERRRCLKTQ